ncbi:MAG: amidinotransferase [Chitinophagaceae bacterium]|nr:amidinotransferase [Chitinophagaceae bacterium]
MQTTSHILMIRPARFNFNAETAVNNSFQNYSNDASIPEKALAEFDSFVKVLREHAIDVTVIQDVESPYTPDSIFPNNWISFHADGIVCLYPMFAENRRLERKPSVLDLLSEKFEIDNILDFTGQEERGLFLEGTGSMVLDRDNQLAYACLSVRTDENVLQQFCDEMGFQPVVFSALDADEFPIYHTNVMMCIADQYAVICLESIPDLAERTFIVDQILATDKKIIPISIDQMNRFAGNMLQVENGEGQKYLVMSTQAFKSLTEEQIEQITAFNEIIHSDLSVIEANGGGSARCMMAEIFLPVK